MADSHYFLSYDDNPEPYLEDDLSGDVVWLLTGPLNDGSVILEKEGDEDDEDFEENYDNYDEDTDELCGDEEIQEAIDYANNEPNLIDNELDAEVLAAFRKAGKQLNHGDTAGTLTGMIIRWK